jgi:hypothetical protein
MWAFTRQRITSMHVLRGIVIAMRLDSRHRNFNQRHTRFLLETRLLIHDCRMSVDLP